MSLYITDENGKLHKLAGAGGGSSIVVDSELNAESENPVQNKVVTQALENRYTKEETYSQQQVDELISGIETGGGSSIVVDSELNAESENPVQNKVLYNPVTFAESERQKSKNLFNINAPRFVHGWHTSVSGNTITTAAGGDTTDDAVFELIPVKEGVTYYIGANVSNQRLMFRIYDENKNIIQSAIPNWTYNVYWEGSYADFASTDIKTHMTIPTGAKYLAFFTAWWSREVTVSNLIISEYPDVENYQPYNPILRKNDLSDLLNNSGLTLVGEIKLTSNGSSITFENVGGEVGDVYRLVVVGSSTSANDGRVAFNGLGYNNYSMCELAGYTEGTSVSVQLLEECLIRTDVKGFFIDVNFGVTSNNNGSSIWIDSRNCSTSNKTSKTTFFKYTQGFLPNQSSINTITISSGSPFYAGTSAKLYKVGN